MGNVAGRKGSSEDDAETYEKGTKRKREDEGEAESTVKPDVLNTPKRFIMKSIRNHVVS